MRTSASGIYAAVTAEFDGGVVGLWATASAQAEVAARSALGLAATLDPTPPVAILKGVGVDLMSIGRVDRRPGEFALRWYSSASSAYVCVVLASDGRLMGAIFVDHPGLARLAVKAMQGDRHPGPLLDALVEDPAELTSDERPAVWPPPPTGTDECLWNPPVRGVRGLP